jgi:hypothetical protein
MQAGLMSAFIIFEALLDWAAFAQCVASIDWCCTGFFLFEKCWLNEASCAFVARERAYSFIHVDDP